MAYGKDIQAKCELLYVESNSSIEDLHRVFDIPKNTIHRWKQKYKWDDRKKAHVLSPIRLAQKLREQIGMIMNKAEEEKRPLTAKETDMIAKLQKAEYKIAPNATILSIGMDVINDFMVYLKGEDDALAREVLPISQDFMRTLFKPKSGI